MYNVINMCVYIIIYTRLHTCMYTYIHVHVSLSVTMCQSYMWLEVQTDKMAKARRHSQPRSSRAQQMTTSRAGGAKSAPPTERPSRHGESKEVTLLSRSWYMRVIYKLYGRNRMTSPCMYSHTSRFTTAF